MASLGPSLRETPQSLSFDPPKATHAQDQGSDALKSPEMIDASNTHASANTVQERAVGIAAFVTSDAAGFHCTIKHRYTDFLVNEILPDGTVLHLTSDVVAAKAGAKRFPADETSERISLSVSDALSKKRELPSSGEPVPDLNESPLKKPRLDGEDPASNGLPFDNTPAVTSSIHTDEEPTSNEDGKDQIIAGVPQSDKAVLDTIFGEDTTKRILNLYASTLTYPGRKPRDHATIKSEPIAEKAKRTEAHVVVRRIFDSKLETLMIQDSPGVISIKAAPTQGPSGARAKRNGESSNGAYQKGKLGWEELGGEYLHFTLYKENKDTMEVLYYIASQLKVPIKNFQFAGTKDRRGVTVQRVAIFRIHAERIVNLNRTARGWRVGDFEYLKHGLELGELGGNEFLLTLRDCHFAGHDGVAHEERLSLAEKAMEEAAASFNAKGFLNYYGLQRFGTFSTGTHVIGQKMLRGDLEGAVDAILTYSDHLLPENQDMSGSTKVPQDDINRADAIRTWRTTGRSNDASSRIPRRFQAEASIIQYLSKRDRRSGKLLQDKDWQGALMTIQRNLRLMYVHAYQSFVWNTIVGKRWDLYGDRVVEGDLVIVGEKDGEPAPMKTEVDEDGEPIFHPTADDGAPLAEDSYTRARPITKEEAESGKYDIFDVVLPLPGYDVSYPANAVGKFYEEFMASEAGGSMDPHNMRRSWKDVSLSGSYRKMMARPGKGFRFEIRTYISDEEQMIETDLERIKKRAKIVKSENMDVDSGSARNGNQQDSVTSMPDPEHKIAVILKLQLGSSQYATMALRELTKGGAVNYKPDYSSR